MSEITLTPNISNIAIGDGVVEFTYTEPGDLQDGVAMVRTVGCDTNKMELDEFEEFLESAHTLLDAALLAFRLAKEKAK